MYASYQPSYAPRRMPVNRQQANKAPSKNKLKRFKNLFFIGGIIVIFIVSITSFGTSSASALGGPIKSGLQGYCLDDHQGKLLPGNKVDLWRCNSTSAQDWQVTLTHVMHGGNYCLSAAAKNSLVINKCDLSPAEVWLPEDKGLINPNLGLCLSAGQPGQSALSMEP